jgi:hypothetical protein
MKKFKVVLVEEGSNVKSINIMEEESVLILAKKLAKIEGKNLKFYKEWLGEDFKWEDMLNIVDWEEECLEGAEFCIGLDEDLLALVKEVK